MQTEVFTAFIGEKIQEAINRLKIKKDEGSLENIYQLFVVDKGGLLLFSIGLEDLILLRFFLKPLKILLRQGG